ncbi:hypothetical protein NBG4_530008 [Candidatus Sulfobium mesophilum]|uniref:Uncharacterized protein n=1 Tax=Candidatus Sulfobium mesophilum TaxID=2016548 RepID=A0A2U3QJ15_9BACT|nr:hypothetical protein NBG4_530008 [Candidatus Sulfobium mesophilum]
MGEVNDTGGIVYSIIQILVLIYFRRGQNHDAQICKHHYHFAFSVAGRSQL